MKTGWIALAALPLSACSSQSGTSVSGETVFRKCAACHNVEPSGRSGLGPNLHGVFGRKAASLPGFNYSAAMRSTGFTWDAKTLDHFLTSPQRAVPGTKMTFGGLSNPNDRRKVIDYLRRDSAAKP